MQVLKRVGVLSCAKISGMLYALIGLLVGAFISLLSLIGATAGLASGEEGAALGLIFGVGAIIIMPIFYGVLGAIGGLISAWFYNILAGIVGGIELELEGPAGGV